MPDYYDKDQIDQQAGVIGGAIKTRTSADHIVSEIASAADANLITDAEKAAIASIPDNHYKGDFVNLAAIPTEGAVKGDWAVITVTGGDDTKALWDDDDGKWVNTKSTVTAETAASIKTKYESNADTNAFTDAEKNKLAGINVAADISSFTAAFNAALA